jgi:hypothetical protein
MMVGCNLTSKLLRSLMTTISTTRTEQQQIQSWCVCHVDCVVGDLFDGCMDRLGSGELSVLIHPTQIKDAKRDEICAGQARVAAGRRQRGAAVRVRNTMLFVERSKRERTYGSVMRALMECLKRKK